MTLIATLPDQYLERDTIADMELDETRWVQPWAMSVDVGQRCWLNGRFVTADLPEGTARIAIRRDPSGYTVYLPEDETWTPGERIPWTGTVAGDVLPVLKVQHMKELAYRTGR